MFLKLKKHGVFLLLLIGALLVGCQSTSPKGETPLSVDDVALQMPHVTNCVKIGRTAYKAYALNQRMGGRLKAIIGADAKPYARGFVNLYASIWGNTVPLDDRVSEHDFITQCIAQQDEVEKIMDFYAQDMEDKIGYMASVLEFTNACYWPEAYAERLESIQKNIAEMGWAVGFEDELLKQYEKVLDTVIASPEKVRKEQLAINMPLIRIVFERITLDDIAAKALQADEEAKKELKRLEAK